MRTLLAVSFSLLAALMVAAQITPIVSWNASAITGYCAVPGHPSAPETTDTIAVWYEANNGPVCSGGCSNGSAVTSWNDQSGHANNLTLAAGTATFNTNQLNSLPAVVLNTTARLTMGSAISSTDIATMFVVFKSTNTSSGGGSLFRGGTSAFIWQFTGTNQTEIDAQGSCALSKGTSGGITPNVFHNAMARMSGNSSAPGLSCLLHVDEVVDTTTLCSNTCNPTGSSAFGPAGGSGTFTVAEAIYYATKLSDANVVYNECYLVGKYGI